MNFYSMISIFFCKSKIFNLIFFSDLVNVRQDGAVQEAEKIAVQRASDRQINLHRISAQTMSMPLNTNKVILTFFCMPGPFFLFSLLQFFIPLTCSWHQKTNSPILQFTNLKCYKVSLKQKNNKASNVFKVINKN